MVDQVPEGRRLAVICLFEISCRLADVTAQWHEAHLSGSFVWVLFALNELPHRYFWWCDNVFKKREKKCVSSRWNSLDTITNSLWVFEIKCLWNHGMKFSIERGCFIQVLFHFKWRGSLGNNVMKLPSETSQIVIFVCD
jgi:hypothetical protein